MRYNTRFLVSQPVYQALLYTSCYDPTTDQIYNDQIYRSPWSKTVSEAICKTYLLSKAAEQISSKLLSAKVDSFSLRGPAG